jgi:tetratricopeptide (TPR) repeat protein
MLHEQLERASKEASKARLKFVLISVVVVVVAGLVLVNVTLFRNLSDLQTGQSAVGGDASRHDPRSASGRSELTPLKEFDKPTPAREVEVPEKQAKRDGMATLPPQPAPERTEISLPPTPAPKTATNPKPDLVQREMAKAALKQFEENLEPQVLTDKFWTWDSKAQQEIVSSKEQAVASFGMTDYKNALEQIVRATRSAEEHLSARARAFASALSEARTAHETEEYEQASLRIAEALRLEPQSSEALELSRLIEVLPETLILLEAARIARVENNPEVEYASLRKVLELDSSRENLRKRAATLAAEIKERTFFRHIKYGLARIEKRDAKSAQKSLAAARAVFPGRDEVSVLVTKLAVLERELETEHLIVNARIAAAKDDWASALEQYGKAAKIEPNNKAVVDGYALAQSITTLSDQMLQHLRASHRLASPNVASQANQLLGDAGNISEESPKLQAKAQELRDLLALYAMKVQVQIISDGQTRISVRGVGHVGTTSNKTIELKPGKYSFEGMRTGFKSKLIRVEIPPGARRVQVEIYCDEQI